MDITTKRVIKAKHDLCKGKGAFFGTMAFSLPTLIDNDIPTAATNGRWIKFNEDFVKSLSDAELKGVICHEMYHVVLQHIIRAKSIPGVDHQTANIAMDYVVNYGIKHSKGDFGVIKSNWYYSDKYNYDWSWEKVYYDILQENAKGAGASGRGELADSHEHFGSADAPTEEQIKAAASAAMTAAGPGANIPSEIKKWLTTQEIGKQDWRRILKKLVTDILQLDKSYMVANRRSGFNDTILMPGRVKDKKYKIAIAIDTSGSISEEVIRIFLRELRAICSVCKNLTVDIWSFNTSIHNPQSFNSYQLTQLMNYEPAGSGGTDFDINYAHMKNNSIKPDIFVMMTDGEPFGSWGDAKYCKTVFAINSGRSDKPVPPFGTCLYID